MRIDSHQHYWRYDPIDYSWISDDMPLLKRDILPSAIAEALKQHKMDGVIAVQARQTLRENEFLLGLAVEHSWIKGVIGWVDIGADDLTDQLAHYKNTAMKGFRHLIQDELNPSEFFEGQKFNQGIQTLLKADYLYEVLFHEKDLRAATAFCQRHDDYPLIIDHLGKPNIVDGDYKAWRNRIKSLAELPHVYCKLSGLITEAPQNWQPTDIYPFIDIAIELFTPERLMFGSDWPVCQLAGNYQNVYELVEHQIALLTEHERDLIMGGVACQIYGLYSYR